MRDRVLADLIMLHDAVSDSVCLIALLHIFEDYRKNHGKLRTRIQINAKKEEANGPFLRKFLYF